MGHPTQPTPAQLRADVCKVARSLVGIHEVPPHSNTGPPQVDGVGVRIIQGATGAFGAPWCVSTVQYIWKRVLGSTWAQDTANAYYLAEYARESKRTLEAPVPGCAVVYHIGSGHAGTVVALTGRTFEAIEGNEADAVRLMSRDPRTIGCTFILRPELHG